MSGASYAARVTQAASGLLRGRMAQQAVWLAGAFGLQQLLRLAASVILARLLAPEMFGVMVLVNTLRTGTELLSDIGIGQSVVRSPHAHDRRFLDTAWTVQAARGVLLCALALAAAWPIAQVYGNPELAPIISLVSVAFLVTGLQSPAVFLMQRDMRVIQHAVMDLVITAGQSVVTIALARAWGDQWALVWGLVLGSGFATLMTYAWTGFRLPRPRWDRAFAVEIFNFGKWIFLSTAVYFAAISTDKIYLSAVLPLALVGIYGVARTFSDMLGALAQRLGQFLVFPRVVELRLHHGEVSAAFQRKRRLALMLIAAGMAVALAGSDRLVLVLYDPRYHAAAFMLPVLLAGAWFSVLAAFCEATLFGLDRPQASAAGNGVKFAVLLVGLPLFVPTQGIFAGLLVLAAAEVGRWLALSLALRREQLATVGEDLLLTLLLFAAAASLKTGFGAIGLTPDWHAWWALGRVIHG